MDGAIKLVVLNEKRIVQSLVVARKTHALRVVVIVALGKNNLFFKSGASTTFR